MQAPLSPLCKPAHLHSHFLLHTTQPTQMRVQANAKESAGFRADFTICNYEIN